MTGKALPATDLSSAFAPPTRAAGLRLPPRKSAQGAPVPARRPVSPVPDPTPTEELEGAQNADSPEPGETPAARKARPAKKASKRTPAKDRTTQQSTEAPAPSAVAPVDEPAPETAAEAPRPAAKAAAPKRTAVSRDSSEPGRLVLWTTVGIRSRMKALQADTERVYRDQVLDALEATHRQLPELLKKTSTAATTKVHGELFERVEAATSTANSDERKQLTIRGFLESQLDVIDHLVTSTGANSRSALINAALDAYLPQR